MSVAIAVSSTIPLKYTIILSQSNDKKIYILEYWPAVLLELLLSIRPFWFYSEDPHRYKIIDARSEDPRCYKIIDARSEDPHRYKIIDARSEDPHGYKIIDLLMPVGSKLKDDL